MTHFTDIITFTFQSQMHPIIAEIYISVERVRENAFLLKTDYQQELYSGYDSWNSSFVWL